MSKHRIAVIPGDGIGKEVVPEGIRVLDAVASKFDITFQHITMPHLIGIGFEGKADLYREMKALSG